MRYKYEITGGAADGQTWTTAGEIEIDMLGDFPKVPMTAIKESFMDLTQGKAVFGHPGVGCRGPFTIDKMTVEAIKPD